MGREACSRFFLIFPFWGLPLSHSAPLCNSFIRKATWVGFCLLGPCGGFSSLLGLPFSHSAPLCNSFIKMATLVAVCLLGPFGASFLFWGSLFPRALPYAIPLSKRPLGRFLPSGPFWGCLFFLFWGSLFPKALPYVIPLSKWPLGSDLAFRALLVCFSLVWLYLASISSKSSPPGSIQALIPLKGRPRGGAYPHIHMHLHVHLHRIYV